MNRGNKIKQMRKFILKYVTIDKERKRTPDRYYPPYRKGSYEAVYTSKNDECKYGGVIGHINKYEVYKSIVRDIKEYEKMIADGTF